MNRLKRIGVLVPLSLLLIGCRQQPPLEEADTALSLPAENPFDLLVRNVTSGGPPKDGIPAIDDPMYTTAAEAETWLQPRDVVFGLTDGDVTIAFPQRILVWHEIANITVGKEARSITYCPLTGTAIGYKGILGNGSKTTFGVSGKLVNSNLLMYDRATDSRWPQILGQAISGPERGASLSEFPLVWTTWERWRDQHPETRVLSRETGYLRDYSPGGDPYGSYLDENAGYYTSDRVIFPLTHEDNRLPPKTVVVGVRDAEGNAAAVTKDRLRREGKVELKLGRVPVLLIYDPALDAHTATRRDTGAWVHSLDAFWFAWAAFFPESMFLP